MGTNDQIAPVDRYALVPTNPTVVAISKAFGWRPTTTIARVEHALPEKFEQQIYLAVVEGFRIYPESLAKILGIYRGTRALSVRDLERRPVGKNCVSNSFGDFSDFLESCMHLVKIVSKEFAAFSLGMLQAAHIVAEYGTDSPEQVVEMIDTNLDECCEYFGVGLERPYSERMRICTFLFIDKVLPELHARGVPNPLDPDEFINSSRKFAVEDEITDREISEKLRHIYDGGLPL